MVDFSANYTNKIIPIRKWTIAYTMDIFGKNNIVEILFISRVPCLL